MRDLLVLCAAVSAFALCCCLTATSATTYGQIVAREKCASCVNGDCIADHGTLKCRCYKNWSGLNCSESTVCTANQTVCLNGGICLIDTHNISAYHCSCPLGFFGTYCEFTTQGDACDSNPCNNSTCYNVAGGGFKCICSEGLYGETCNYTTNFCENETCNGNGYCTVITKSSSTPGGEEVWEPHPLCSCDPDYERTSKCEFHSYVDVCDERGPQPCSNNGVCTSYRNLTYTCDCPSNFTGTNCTEPYDVCLSDPPCLNGGTCSPTHLGHYFHCDCPDNFMGDRCQYVIDPCVGACPNDVACMRELPDVNGHFNITSYSCHDHCNPDPCGEHGACTNLQSGYECECDDGFEGQHCTQHNVCGPETCHAQNTERCITVEDRPLCVCREGWGGKRCDKLCHNIDGGICNITRDLCNGGECVNTLSGYNCQCPPGTTGYHCEASLECSDTLCHNGGTCDDDEGIAVCTCPPTFTGPTCQQPICPYPSCTQQQGDSVCNYECLTPGCGNDGRDCYLSGNSSNVWSSCPSAAYCQSRFNNGVCDVQCNTPACYFDGNDCQPQCEQVTYCQDRVQDDVCQEECNNQICPYDFLDCGKASDLLPGELVLILLTERSVPFTDPYRSEVLSLLATLTNTIPILTEVSVITREELNDLSTEHNINFNIFSIKENLTVIYMIKLRFDVRYCRLGCPDNTLYIVELIEAYFNTNGPNLSSFYTAAAYTVPPTNPTNPSSLIAGVVVVVAVLAIIVLVVFGVLLGKRKVQAKIWRPRSPASESDSREGRRSSQAGGTVTGMDPSNIQRSDSDEQLSKAKKAKMLPTSGHSYIKYRDIEGRYEVGKDERQWNSAHYQAVNNPKQVEHLVREYRRQHGESLDVNAPGPGGYTPLMLAVMKRRSYSSFENIHYGNASRHSSVSSDCVLLPPQPQHHPLAHNLYLNNPWNGAPNGASATSYTSLTNGLHDSGYFFGMPPSVESSVGSLLRSNVNLDAANDMGQTALQLAAACSRADYVEQLLNAGANPNIADNWNQGALQVAIGAGAEGSFMFLLNNPKTDINQKSDGGITPLMAAVKVVNQYMLKQLIKKNADIAATDNDGRTALHWAAMVDNLEALKLLIRHGPETIKDAQDNKGQTALFLACREGSFGCVKHLIDCFANTTLLDNLDQAPIQIAMEKQHLDIVELLNRTGPVSYHPMPPKQHPSYIDQMHSGDLPMHFQFHPPMKLTRPLKSRARSQDRNLVGASPAHSSYMRHQQELAYYHHAFGEMNQQSGLPNDTSVQTSTSIPMTMLNGGGYSNSGGGASASGESTSPGMVHGQGGVAGSPPTTIPSSNYNTELHPSTTPPSATHPSPPSTGYTGYEYITPTCSNDMSPASNSGGIQTSPQTFQTSPQSFLPPTSSTIDSTAGGLFSNYEPQPSVSTYSHVNGSTIPLQHHPLDTIENMNHVGGASGTGAPPTMMSAEGNYYHSSPPQVPSKASSGSPQSAYPSPLHSDINNGTMVNGYASSSHTSPPSLTPSPESHEDQLVNAHGTFTIEMGPCSTHLITHNEHMLPMGSSMGVN